MLTVLDETRDFRGTTTPANPPTLYPIEAAGIEGAGIEGAGLDKGCNSTGNNGLIWSGIPGTVDETRV